jgi:prepilin-type N-terminal cleavage/methylation domain-containing protein
MQRVSNTKGFTLVELIVAMVVSVILVAAAGGILITSMNLLAHEERSDNLKMISTTVAGFLEAQTHFAAEIYPTKTEPTAKPTKTSYAIPTADEWLTSVKGADSPAAARESSYKKNALFYVGDIAGNPASKGYLFYKRAGDAGDAVNVFGQGFYNNLLMTLDVTEVRNAATGAIVVTQTIRLYDSDNNEVRADASSFDLVNTVTQSSKRAGALAPSSPDFVEWPSDINIDVAESGWQGYYSAVPLG